MWKGACGCVVILDPVLSSLLDLLFEDVLTSEERNVKVGN